MSLVFLAGSTKLKYLTSCVVDNDRLASIRIHVTRRTAIRINHVLSRPAFTICYCIVDLLLRSVALVYSILPFWGGFVIS